MRQGVRKPVHILLCLCLFVILPYSITIGKKDHFILCIIIIIGVVSPAAHYTRKANPVIMVGKLLCMCFAFSREAYEMIHDRRMGVISTDYAWKCSGKFTDLLKRASITSGSILYANFAAMLWNCLNLPLLLFFSVLSLSLSVCVFFCQVFTTTTTQHYNSLLSRQWSRKRGDDEKKDSCFTFYQMCRLPFVEKKPYTVAGLSVCSLFRKGLTFGRVVVGVKIIFCDSCHPRHIFHY